MKREGEYIWFGEYPQTIKAYSVTVGTTADSRGYFLGGDGARYAKVVASPRGNNYKFSTGTTVIKGDIYYFKVEPIKWKVLNESDGSVIIFAKYILDNHRYNEFINKNNYMKSEIRAWLNNEFYNYAFNNLQKQIILTTEVDNSLLSTGNRSNPYVCANTNDKLFLLSRAEARNTSYGFAKNDNTNQARVRLTSDYSRSKGVGMETAVGPQYGNGCWWLRSPYDCFSDIARCISCEGHINCNDVNFTYCGVVPALKIQL
jgi:hypothetical protein